MSILNKIRNSNFYTIIRHGKNYFGAQIATKAIAFLYIPVLTRLLSPFEYGIINVFNSYVSIFLTLFTLNTHTAISRYIYEEHKCFEDFFGTNVILSASIFSVFSLFFIFFQDRFASLLNIPNNLVLFSIPLVIFQIATSLFDQINQALKESKKIALRSILQSALTFPLSILLIYFLNKNKFFGQIYSQVIIGVFFFIYYVIYLKRYFKFTFVKSYVIYIFKYTLPLLPYHLSSVIIGQFSRVFINFELGSIAAGLYSYAYNIGMLLVVFSSSLFNAWIPDYFKFMNEEKYDLIEKNVKKIFSLILVAALFLVSFGKEIGLILARENYHSALKVIPFIVMGYVFESIFSIYSWGMGYEKKTGYTSLIVITAGIFTVILNAKLIPLWGVEAGAYSTLISYIIMASMAWFFNRTIMKDKPIISLKEIVKLLFLFLPFLVINFLVINYIDKLLFELLLKFLFFCLFFSIIIIKIFMGYRYERKS